MSDDSATSFFLRTAETRAVDLWDRWERQLQTSGRPDRLATELSDEELVNLLAAKPSDHVPPPAAIALKQEALRRLHRAHRPDRGNLREPYPPTT